ncbi:Uncharacterised protein [Mycoplasmopsis citelli]|uniref:Lipoprotein n=1 Tax=Mycoplasmopsis citelli TaxID=171281 RepID=A0A449B1L6_9BACT|nr:hypothetical protein [Mycoplasmopsis citelli]VEU74461.1 Uncharacterised protein [Mycoplasmopsis citelli]
MTKNWKKLLFFNSTIIPISSLILVSCTQNKRIEIEEQIAKALQNDPYAQIRPLIYTPSKDLNLNNYTAETLDCLGFIQGNNFTDKQGNTYHSKIISVVQNVLSDSAEIKTIWTKNGLPEIINYPKTFYIEGFKPIPIQHTHYVRTEQIQNSPTECLNKYNGK